MDTVQFPINLDMYVAIIGFFLPVIIAAIVKPDWPAMAKYWVSFAIVCVASFGHLWFAGQWSIVDLPGSILKMLSLTIGSYLIFWRPSGINDKIETKINGGAVKVVVIFAALSAMLIFTLPAKADSSFVGRTAGVTIGDAEYTITFSEAIFGPCPGGSAQISGPGFGGDPWYSYYSDCGSQVLIDFDSPLLFIITGAGLILVPPDAITLDWK